MSRINRKFSLDEKLKILSEADQNGIEQTIRKYQLSRSLYYNWKNKFDRQGTDGLSPKYNRVDPEKKSLEKENERLRKIIARQAIELEIKEELLKKTRYQSR